MITTAMAMQIRPTQGSLHHAYATVKSCGNTRRLRPDYYESGLVVISSMRRFEWCGLRWQRPEGCSKRWANSYAQRINFTSTDTHATCVKDKAE